MRRLGVLLIICAWALPVSVARAWTWPVDGPVLRPFSFDHGHPYAPGQHRGIDLGAPSGSRVLAPADGVVSFAGTVPTGGKTVSIQTSFGYTATLVHLGSISVRRGALVGEASVVGTVGPSGVVDRPEPYVYFGTRVTGDDQGYVDPLSLLPPHVTAKPPVAEESNPEAPASAPGNTSAETGAAETMPVNTETPAGGAGTIPTPVEEAPPNASAGTIAAPSAEASRSTSTASVVSAKPRTPTLAVPVPSSQSAHVAAARDKASPDEKVMGD